MDKEFENILNSRNVPEAPGNLAYRIIEAAKQKPKTQAAGSVSGPFWDMFAEMFILPKPAVALALALLVGLTLGFGSMNPAEVQLQDLSSLLQIEDEFYTGDFS